MSFFLPEPLSEEPEIIEPEETVGPPWWAPPADELPILLASPAVLTATEQVSVALIGTRVYREGVEVCIERRLRRNGLARGAWQELIGSFIGHRLGGDQDGEAGRVRYGLVLGDGQHVLDGSSIADGAASAPQGHALTRTGGGGSGDGSSYSVSDALWLWPLPPEGLAQLVFQWPAFGIGEVRASFDVAPILEASHRVQPFWP